MAKDIENKLKRLQHYNDSPAPILSVYYNLPIPNHSDTETKVNKLNTIMRTHLTQQQFEEMKTNIAMINGFLDKYQHRYEDKALAIFSGGENLFEAIHLPFKVNNFTEYAHSPFLKPILSGLEEYRRYLVIMNDREKAILFTLVSGNLEDQKEVYDNSVPQNVRGRWPESQYANRQSKVQRHIQDHLSKHFDVIADKAKEFIAHKEISGVILGGHIRESNQLEKHLPKELQDKIVGKFVSELKINFNQILEKSQQVVVTVNRQINQGKTPTVSYS